MKSKMHFLIIGDVFTDFHLNSCINELCLGGVFHSARAFSVLGKKYYLGVFYSDYQRNAILEFSPRLNCQGLIFLGKYINRPNTMIVQDSCEAGNQGYRNILYAQKEIEYSLNTFESFLLKNRITDALIFPGDYELEGIIGLLNKYNIKIHIDLQYSDFIPPNVTTLITSTSAKNKVESFEGLISKYLDKNIGALLLKENRGGARLFTYNDSRYYDTCAYLVDTVHSVGVGDVFNAALISSDELNNNSLEFASKVAALYASTNNYELFAEKVKSLQESKIEMIPYVRSSWEKRPELKIYLAAPDFPNTSTRVFADLLEEKLAHHNFSIFRPILVNGLIDNRLSDVEKKIIYEKDLVNIYNADLCVALLNEDDGGTAAEIGIFTSLNIPIVGYCSNQRMINNFVINSCNVIVDNLLDLIEKIFVLGKKRA